MGEKPRQPVLIGNSEEMLIMNSDDPSLFKISILAINYNFSTLKKKSLFLFHTITYRCYFGFKQGLLSISTYLIDVQWLSPIPLFGTPWTVASQAPLSMGFPRQEYWSGFPFPSPGYLPDSGIKPRKLITKCLSNDKNNTI